MGTANRRLWGCFLVAAAVLAANMVAAQERGGRDPRGTEIQEAVKAVDVAGMKITIAVPPGRDAGRDASPTETTFSLAKDVEVALGTSFGWAVAFSGKENSRS